VVVNGNRGGGGSVGLGDGGWWRVCVNGANVGNAGMKSIGANGVDHGNERARTAEADG